MVKFLDLNAQYKSIKDEIDEAISKTIDRGSFIGGPDVKSFEAEFAGFQGAAHCVGVGNGTDAIEIVLEALELPRGSEIIVPANSFIASSEAVTRNGNRVVFCEVGDDYLMDPADVAARITNNTSAIICVHLYGHPCNMSALQELARAHSLKLIEDAAQAHGAEIDSARIGAIGDAGTFSFYPGKNLGGYGDGGAIVTNDEFLALRCRMIANHGRIDKYDHKFEGRNSRLDGLQAAILRAKLRHLDKWIDQRNAVARAYIEGLADLSDLALPQIALNVRHAFHLFVVRCARRDQLQAHLKAEGIDTGIHYPIALPDLEAYEYLRDSRTPSTASAIAPTLLSLPIGEHMTNVDVEQVINSVRRFFG